MRNLFFSALCCLLISTSYSQDAKKSGTIPSTYMLPQNENGLRAVSIMFEYTLTKMAGELVLVINVKSIGMGIHDFMYKGVSYPNWGDLLANVGMRDPVIRVRATGPGVNKTFEMTVHSEYAGGLYGHNAQSIVSIGKESASSYDIFITDVLRVKFTNTEPIIARINELEKAKEKNEKANALIKEAEKLTNAGDHARAKSKLEEAKRLTPDNSNIDNYIAEVNEKIEEKKAAEKRTADLEKEKAVTSSAANGGSSSKGTTNTSQSSGSNATNTISDANKRYEEELAKVQKMQREADERQRTEQALSNQRAAEFSKSVGTIVDGFMAASERNAEKRSQEYFRNQANLERDRERSQLLLNVYSQDAEKGNEEAIAKVAEAYNLIENPKGYFYRIEEDNSSVYWKSKNYSDKPVKYLDFLTKMYRNYKSPVATTLLTNYYSEIVKSYQKSGKTHRKKASSRLIWGTVVGVGIGYFGSTYILNNDNLLRDQQGLKDGIYYTAGVGGMLSGFVLLVSGVIHSGWAKSYKSDAEYIKANRNINALKNRTSLSFAPSYNYQHNTIGFTAKLNF